MYQEVTAVLISFLRPGYTEACISSLIKQCPGINIAVADNAGDQPAMRQFCEQMGVRYYPQPYDSGVCQARNFLISQVYTPYVLVGDDDFYYTPEAMVEGMVYFLDNHPEFDLIGGRVSENEVTRNYQGYIERLPDHIKIDPVDLEGEFESDGVLEFKKCDLTFNYFLARVDKIKPVPWDDKIKVAYEHLTWFVDFKQAGGQVAFSPNPVVIHKPRFINPRQAQQYADFRNRKEDRDYFFERFGIDYTIQMNGRKDIGPAYMEKMNNKMKGNDTKDVDFCITTFKRPEALKNLLFSIAEYYPMASVFVADQNYKFDREFYKRLKRDLQEAGLVKRIAVDTLPYDCGLSYARNYLMRTTPSKYKLLLEDDFVFTEKTDIGKMVKILNCNKNIGIVGGSVDENGYRLNFEFNIELKDGVLTQVPDGNNYREFEGIKYRRTGCVLNFALMRHGLFQYIQWDNDLKVSEHIDFYLKMKNVPYQIAYVQEVVIGHCKEYHDEDYKLYRQRTEFQALMFRKNKIKKMKYLNGQVVELLPNGAFKRYKEEPNNE